MTRIINLSIRVILTALLVAWAVYPYLSGSSGESVLGEILKVGIVPTLVITAAFFIMVAFYCRTLQKCLTLIQPQNRKADTKSVWYMFAIPFNFIEDFFIVINIANSIEEEKKKNSRLSGVSDVGMVSGIGWSIAQVLSFIPNIVGQIAGGLGMVLVVFHWVQIARINKLLGSNPEIA
jgi:hypothetical protein